MPSVINKETLEVKTEGEQFGVGVLNDHVQAYKGIFDLTETSYRILTICIYEVLNLFILNNKNTLNSKLGSNLNIILFTTLFSI